MPRRGTALRNGQHPICANVFICYLMRCSYHSAEFCLFEAVYPLPFGHLLLQGGTRLTLFSKLPRRFIIYATHLHPVEPLEPIEPSEPFPHSKTPQHACCGVFKYYLITRGELPVSYPVRRSGEWYLQNGPCRSCSGEPVCWFWHRRQSSGHLSASRSQ